jgi:hypothetical protein
LAYFFGVTVTKAFSAEDKDAWSHTSTFRCTFMTWWFIRHAGNYVFRFVAGNGVVEVVLRRLIGYDYSVSKGQNVTMQH